MEKNMNQRISLVYMVAGLSSRFQGRIKQLVKITKNETLIEYSLNQALKAGFTKIIFIVNENTYQPFKELFKYNYKGVPIQYVFQTYDREARDKPWGTADALCSAKHLLNNPFIICNGDDIYGENVFKILTEHLKNQENINRNYQATVGYKLINVLPEKGAVHRAIFQTDENNFVTNLKEILDIEKNNLPFGINSDDLCSMNIFALYPETLEYLHERLKQFKEQNKNSRTKECFLPNELSKLIQEQKIKIKLYPTNEKWFGITNPEDEEIVRELLRNKKI